MQKVKWGIIGSGKIARRFVADLKLLDHALAVGVVSRDYENAIKFGSEFGIKSFASIEGLLASDAEVIYVATPHPHHREYAIAAIESGKTVLCEKPFAMNARPRISI